MAKKKKTKLMGYEGDDAIYETVEVEEEAAPVAPKAEEPKIEFDAWFAMRSAVIPKVHKKEIIKADFKARKIPMVASIAEFDKALKKYGVELK